MMTIDAIVPILLSIIAFWLIRYINRSDKKLDFFTTQITELTTQFSVFLKNYEMQNRQCNKMFNVLEDDITIIKKDVASLDDCVTEQGKTLTKLETSVTDLRIDVEKIEYCFKDHNKRIVQLENKPKSK